MMRVLLIATNTERINMVTIPLGLGLVAAATRAAGHEVSFLDLLGERDPVWAVERAVESARPQVIGLSIRNIDDQAREAPRFMLEQARPVVAACRVAGVPIVLGGPGFSLFPDATLDYLGADIGVVGDGETAFPAVLERLAAGRDVGDVPGVRVAGRPVGPPPAFADDLDALPAWDETLTEAAGAPSGDLWIPVQTRRGCPNDCSYCSTARIQGRRMRLRDPRPVVETIASLAARGHRRFFFVDNSFNIPEPHALATCELLGALAPGVSWRCIVYPHRLGENLVRAMAAAGCVEVSLGFESGSLPILEAMNKRFTTKDIRAASDLLAAHGIRRLGFLLLGGPGETRETVRETLAFAASLELDMLRTTVGIRIYPGTRLARRAVEDGVIRADDDLLRPRFYLASGLDGWIQPEVEAWQPTV